MQCELFPQVEVIFTISIFAEHYDFFLLVAAYFEQSQHYWSFYACVEDWIECSEDFSHLELSEKGILSEDEVYHDDSIFSFGFLVLGISIVKRWYILSSFRNRLILPQFIATMSLLLFHFLFLVIIRWLTLAVILQFFKLLFQFLYLLQYLLPTIFCLQLHLLDLVLLHSLNWLFLLLYFGRHFSIVATAEVLLSLEIGLGTVGLVNLWNYMVGGI